MQAELTEPPNPPPIPTANRPNRCSWWTEMGLYIISSVSLCMRFCEPNPAETDRCSPLIWIKRFWRQTVLKKLTSSEVPLQKQFTRRWRHQRFWRSSEAGRLKNFQNIVQMKIKSRLSLQKIGRIKQRLFQWIGCLFSWESWKKGHLYEVYSHYLHYSVFVSAGTGTTVVPNSCACNFVPSDLK